MHKIISMLFVLLIISSCGPAIDSPADSLLGLQPRVVRVSPGDNQTAAADFSIEVEFSREVDPLSIGRYSFLVIPEFTPPPSKDALTDALSDGELVSVDGEYSISNDRRLIRFVPAQSGVEGATYGVILTNDIHSIDFVPLNQTPGSSPTPFISRFLINSSAPGVDIAETGVEGGSGSGSGGSGSTSGGTSGTQSKPPEYMWINEVVYDAVGADTEGDLFVELIGTPKGAIGGYSINFVNGDDGKITDSIKLPTGATIPEDGIYVIADAITGNAGSSHVSDADYIVNFDPHNGPDGIQLLNSAGVLMDGLCYGTTAAKIAENGLVYCLGSPANDVASGESLSRRGGAENTLDNSADFAINNPPSPGSLDVTEKN